MATDAGRRMVVRKGDAVAIAVEDASQVGEARRTAMALAADADFDEGLRSDVGIVVTEAATNVMKHAGQGEVLVRLLEGTGGEGLEVICVDRGKGIADIDQSLLDGVSSRGTMGGGFGAMRRLADDFSIYSSAGMGTALVCRFWRRGSPDRRGVIALAGLSVAMPGESVCGDGWSAASASPGTAILMADGLGHGPAAAEAAETAVRLFREHPTEPLEQLMAILHAGLRATRGAAAAVAAIDPVRREVRYVGVGNISASIVSPLATRNLVSHNGTVGHQMRKAQEFVYPWESGALLILHSDGLATHWKLDRYPGLMEQDPAIIAAMLYRDHARRRDDAGVVVYRLSAAA